MTKAIGQAPGRMTSKAERFAIVTRAFEGGAFNDLIGEFWDDSVGIVDVARRIEARVLSMFGFFIWFGWLRSNVSFYLLGLEERAIWNAMSEYDGRPL